MYKQINILINHAVPCDIKLSTGDEFKKVLITDADASSDFHEFLALSTGELIRLSSVAIIKPHFEEK